MKGNDLRYNLYLTKMQKLSRKDLGLDVEGYKNFINNIKMFAKCNHDFEILAKEDLSIPPGLFNPLDSNLDYLYEESLESQTEKAQLKEKTKQLKNSIGKLYKDYKSQIFEKDIQSIEEFLLEPKKFLDFDGDLAIDVKKLYDKRKNELAKR